MMKADTQQQQQQQLMPADDASQNPGFVSYDLFYLL